MEFKYVCFLCQQCTALSACKVTHGFINQHTVYYMKYVWSGINCYITTYSTFLFFCLPTPDIIQSACLKHISVIEI